MIMKKSNLFILLGALFTLGLPIGLIALPNKYISVEEFQVNQRETIKSLDAGTYNYKTVIFDEFFDEVMVIDTGIKVANRSSRTSDIQWVKSDQSGFKNANYQRGISSAKVEQNKLIITVSDASALGSPIILYSPSLNKISFENVGVFTLVNTVLDSLEIGLTVASVDVGESNHLKKLIIQAQQGSNVNVKAEDIDDATYVLSTNSTVRSYLDTCNRLTIQGDNTSTVVISPLYEGRVSADNTSKYVRQSTYNYMTFNDEIGTIMIENTTMNKIKGNKDRLKLNMPIKQIEKTLANIVVD